MLTDAPVAALAAVPTIAVEAVPAPSADAPVAALAEAAPRPSTRAARRAARGCGLSRRPTRSSREAAELDSNKRRGSLIARLRQVETICQSLEARARPAQARSRGAQTDPEIVRDFRQRETFELVQHEDRALLQRQEVERSIERFAALFPVEQLFRSVAIIADRLELITRHFARSS